MLKNKKGVMGLDTTKAVMLALLIIAVLGVAIILALQSVSVGVGDYTTPSFTMVNESFAAVTEAGSNIGNISLEGVACSNPICINNTGNYFITDANYTFSNCKLSRNNIADDTGINNTAWKCTYTYSYHKGNQIRAINNNLSSGVQSFFGSVPTIFSILIVVVIILAIAIIIAAVSRFGEGAGGTLGPTGPTGGMMGGQKGGTL